MATEVALVKSSTNKKNLIVGIIVLVLVGGASFYGGMKYQQGQALSKENFSAGGTFNGQQRGTTTGANSRISNGGMVSGEIISKDDASVNVKLKDGGSKIVFYSESTTYKKTTDGTKEDLVVGKQIMANGTSNSDGSITAKSVQLQSDIQPVAAPSGQATGQ